MIQEVRPIDGSTCLVTGGAGFVGLALVRALRKRGCKVHVLDAAPMPKGFADDGVTAYVGDIRDEALVRRALAGVKVVFHTAAIIELARWAPKSVIDLVHSVNVGATEKLLALAEVAGVERLVQTSSTATVLSPDCAGGDESIPYSDSQDLYTVTKVAAEKLVRAHRGTMLTCSIRPGGIYGPGERKQLVGLTFAAMRRGEPVTIIGDGTSRLDYTHVDSLVDAHLRAADRLIPGSVVAGKAYFVSDDQPINHGEFTRRVLRALGMVPKLRYVPIGVLEKVAYLSEKRFARFGTKPLVSQAQIRTCALDYWFDISAARRDLGYVPLYSTDEGILSMVPDLNGYMREIRFRGR